MLMKNVYTTGDVANICNVTIKTVIKWFDSGKLKGYRIPGSRDRRIPHDNLVEFMKESGIPLKQLDQGVRKRILIADDEEGILYVLKKMLGDVGILDIATASSGLETGMKLESFMPHLLILDHLLGDTTSVEVLRNIKTKPQLTDLIIIIMSGYVTDDEVEEMKKEGIHGFIRKPFDLDEVKAMVLRLLGYH